MATTKKKAVTKTGGKSVGFTTEEKAAMKERARELKAAQSREAGEKELLKKVSGMPEPDRSIARLLHTLIMDTAPALMSKTWYGMPAYTNADGKVICFFQAASKFNTRYATFGFQHDANLDDGNMWPTSFALVKLTPAEEKKIAALVKKAAS